MVVVKIGGYVFGPVRKVTYVDDVSNRTKGTTTIECREFFVTEIGDIHVGLDNKERLEKEVKGHVIDVSPAPYSLGPDERDKLMDGKIRKLQLRGGWLPEAGKLIDTKDAQYSYYLVKGVER